MAMLERYRKPGGFIQLLALIETCAPTKQEKLLETVATEDGLWAQTVRSKMLRYDRIISWNDETLMEIFGSLQDLTVAVAIFAADEPLKSRLLGLLSHGRRRKIDDLYGAKPPTPGEVSATYVKIVEAVRKMASDGYIRFEKCDPMLAIGQDIDDRLMRPAAPDTNKSGFAGTSDSPPPGLVHSYSPMSAHAAASGSNSTPASSSSFSAGDSELRAVELLQLKRKLLELGKENATLRHELVVAKSKLEQIKKIA